ncbi:MAG: hypothetical protein ACFFG0_41070, partial [Candidatus Thorarchaeota archaeon]
DALSRYELLYQDALDFINKDLTVAKIYEYVTTKQMNDLDATELLTYFIENSDDADTRSISIQAFKVLGLKNDKVLSTLENCIFSEENLFVKKMALEVIQYLFPKKSKDLIRWVNTHNKKLKN